MAGVRAHEAAAIAILAFRLQAGAGVFSLDIMHTNDVHGGITPRNATFLNPDFPPGIGGGAWLLTYVESVRAERAEAGGYCLFVDAGDIYQGTPVGNCDTGASVIRWMNAAGYEAMTLGNHDFDDGVENALALARAAEFPVLGCNFVSAVDGGIPDPVLDQVMLEYEGVRIALIGLCTTDTWGLVDPELLSGYVFEPEQEAVEREIAQARDQGADLVFLLSHLGQPSDPERYVGRVLEARAAGEEFSKDFALNNAELSTLVPGIDLIISGHTHYGLRTPWINPYTHTIVIQGYANGTGVSHLRLWIDSEAREIVGWELPAGEALVNLLHDEFSPDPDAEFLIEGFREVAESGMDRVLAEASEEIVRGGAEHPMGRLVADAMLASSGADAALMNRGGIRATIPRGPVTPRIVYEAIPFEEDIYLIRLSGGDLRRVLETGMQGRRRDMEPAGFTAVRNQAMPDGSKIESLLIGGIPVDSSRIYTLATTGYLAQGNVGYDLLREFEAVPTGVTLFDAVVDYIETLSVIESDDIERVRWIDEPR